MTTIAAQSKFAQVQGIRMHYWEWGSVGAPDLLFVHGWTGFGFGWAPVAEQLQDRYHIIAPDLRGHGESDKPHAGYRLRDFVEDLHQLIQGLGLRRPAFAGGSWGGNIGTMMAAEHPEEISRALLEDPVYWKMVNAFVTSLPQALARHNRPEAEIRADARQRGLNREQEDLEVYRHHHFSPHAITRLLTDNRDWAFACEEHLRRIKVPTLILVGDIHAQVPLPGYMLPEEMAYYQRIASPLVRLELWPGAGHGIRAFDPARYQRTLEQFLKE